MDVHCFVAHVADDNLLLFVVLSAYFASFAVWALPWGLLHKVCVKRRLMAPAVENLAATATLHESCLFSFKVHFLCTTLALDVHSVISSLLKKELNYLGLSKNKSGSCEMSLRR